jgi:prepilin-type N-terminal cleavage/methylation domain-containing protein
MIRRVTRNEDGVTLIELAVVLFLMSIVAAILMTFLATVMHTTTQTANSTETQKQTALALRPLTGNIRGSESIATVYPSTSSCPAGSYPTGYTNCLSVTVMRPIPGQLSCRRSVFTYGLKSDGVLREDRTDYAIAGGACVVATSYAGRPLLSNIKNGSQALFTYFDRFGNQIDPNAGGQTAIPFTDTVTIHIALNVQYQAGSPLLSYTSDLALRNNR